MANRELGEVSLVAGERTYTLKLDINTACVLEDHFSTTDREVSFVEIAQKAQAGNMRYVRALVWASLQTHHPDIGINDVADLIIKAGGLPKVVEVMGQLSETATPDAQDVKVSGAKKSRRP